MCRSTAQAMCVPMMPILPWITHSGKPLAHAHFGNRAQALPTYQLCIERLPEELGVPPSAATIAPTEQVRAAS